MRNKEVSFFGGSWFLTPLKSTCTCYFKWSKLTSSLFLFGNRSMHHILDGFNRSVANKDQKNWRCDQKHLSPLPAWYRFTGAAGDRMPTSCAPINRCGTNVPGWLAGSHPSAEEGIVTSRVCYHWNSNGCYRKNDIQIKKCNGFYVYRLIKPPECDLRYCGNNAGELLKFGLAPVTEL